MSGRQDAFDFDDDMDSLQTSSSMARRKVGTALSAYNSNEVQ